MAAALVSRLAGAKLADLGAAVESFPGVEHRIEFVRTLDGVDYYNDSKATNVDATLKAINAFPGNLWIILGGKDKGADYTPLREPLRQRAKAALLVGAPPAYPYAAAPLIESLDGALPLIDSGTLKEALHYARLHAAAGDIVLLAPGCASFDQFQNFEERSRDFQTISGRIVLGKMAQRLKTDWILFLTVLTLVCFGLVMVYSASSFIAELKYHVSSTFFFFRQLGWAVVSFLILLYCMRRDYREWKKKEGARNVIFQLRHNRRSAVHHHQAETHQGQHGQKQNPVGFEPLRHLS